MFFLIKIKMGQLVSLLVEFTDLAVRWLEVQSQLFYRWL